MTVAEPPSVLSCVRCLLSFHVCSWCLSLHGFMSHLTLLLTLLFLLVTLLSHSITQEMGLAFDEWDLDYYTKLFK